MNPTSATTSEATLRRLANADDQADRTPRTQSRPPAAWVWAVITLLAVVVAAAAFWIVALQPTQLVPPSAAVEVPDIVGDTWPEAGDQLVALGLNPDEVTQPSDVPAGQIISTDPAAGTKVGAGIEVRVVVSSGPAKVALIGLTFRAEADAIAAIQAAGLVYGVTNQTYSPNVPAGQVVGVQISPDETLITSAQQVVQGSTVNLVVSNGLVQVPDVSGQTFTDAQALLTGSQYQLGVSQKPDIGCTGQLVTAQSIAGDQPQKSTVVLTYCAG